jgi:hypothetical protein
MLRLSRRSFLTSAAGAALLRACEPSATTPPVGSPLRRGRYSVARALLGVTPGTERPAMPPLVHISNWIQNVVNCPGGPVLKAERPDRISVAVYYPAVEESVDVSRSIPSLLHSGRTWPVILYAHARRKWITCPADVKAGLDPSLSDFTQDFRRVDRLLSHVASHGYVIAAPDLGWLVHTDEFADLELGEDSPRATILIAVHDALRAGAGSWFDNRLNFRKLALFGHSTGAAACLLARRQLTAASLLGLIAPAMQEDALAEAEHAPTTLVIGGTRDTGQAAIPDVVFARLQARKILVTMEGANHLGFTELCTVDNQTCMDTDPPGATSRIVQQEVAAAYLAAAARLFLDGAASMKPYLDGTRDIGAAAIGPPVHVTWQ